MATTKRSSMLLAVTFAILALAAPAIARTPQAQIASLKKQLAAAKKTNARLETQNAKLSGLYATEQSWFKQAEATIATQASGGTAAIIAGGPDAMWNAVVGDLGDVSHPRGRLALRLYQVEFDDWRHGADRQLPGVRADHQLFRLARSAGGG